MRYAVLALPLALAGCGLPNGPPLVSAQSPPGIGVVNANSLPQPIDSLPPGAANYSTAPGGYQPSYGSIRFRL
jgi:hypothetical protein